jgi:hypothetical protein
VANVYYIKGQALVMQVTSDPKTGRMIAPPGCIEAYKKYLQLAPSGTYASEVKGIIQGLEATVPASNKANGRK